MASVVVLVLAWNGAEYLPACLEALAAQQHDDRYGVLVVDNGSTDDSVAITRAQFPHVAVMANDRNLGFSAGNNVGLRALLAGTAPTPCDWQPEIVVLLNQDTVVAANWLPALLEVFDRRPEAGIVGCKMTLPDRATLQHVGGSIQWPTGDSEHRGTGEPDQGQYDREEVVEYVAAAALAIRTTVLEEVGLFDEGFSPAYYEDTDLCYRVRTAGYEVVYAPQAQLLHYEGTSLEARSLRHQRVSQRNRLRFVLKHAPLAMLLHDLVPAEVGEMRRGTLQNTLARKHAYLDGVLALPDVLAQRADAPIALAASEEVLAVLRTLHHAVVDEEQTRRANEVKS